MKTVALLLIILLLMISGMILISTNSDGEDIDSTFNQSVIYDPDKGLLSFTIPKSVPKGYKFYLHVSGRLFMGDKSNGMSFHAFDEESQNYSWITGKTYTYPLAPDNLDYIMLDFGLLKKNSKELLYEHIFYVFPDGSKTIYKAD